MDKLCITKKSIVNAVIMGITTSLMCLVLADGILGLNRYGGSVGRGIPGAVVFWVFLIGLPLLFSRWTKWRYTLIDLPIYFLLYFPLAEFFGYKWNHELLRRNGLFYFPDWCNALLVAVMFFIVQSFVFLVYNIIVYFLKKEKKGTESNSPL